MKKGILCVFILINLAAFSQTTFSWRNDQNPGNNASWTSTSPYYFWNGSTGAVPGGGEILFFDGDKGTTMTNNLSSTNRYRISFGSTNASSRTINGSTTNVFYDYSNSIPAIYNNSSVLHTISFPINIGNTSTSTSPAYGMEINAASGGLDISSSISAANSTGTKVLVLMESSSGSGSNINLSGVVSNGSGTMSVVKKGGNTAVISGNNTYTGATTIEGGTLTVSTGGTLGNGSSDIEIKNGATLKIDLGAGNDIDVKNLTINSGGTLNVVSGSISYSGTYTNSGTVTGTTPLPVSLTFFKGTYTLENQANLVWQTASELNASHFNIHKSIDGDFKEYVGSIEANGTSNEVKDYQFVDPEILKTKTFYFLEQVDFDGQTEWFGPVSLIPSPLGSFEAFFTNEGNLHIALDKLMEGDNVEVLLMSSNGALVHRESLVVNAVLIEKRILLPELGSGIYFVRVVAPVGSQVLKINK